MSNLWPVKVRAVAASIMVQPSVERDIMPEHILVCTFALYFVACAPSLVFSVNDRAGTTFFFNQILCASSILLLLTRICPLDHAQRNALVLFGTSHLSCWLSLSLLNRPKLIIHGELWRWFFLLLAVVSPFCTAALLNCYHGSIFFFSVVLFAGEIILIGTFLLSGCINQAGQIYENVWIQ